MDRRETGRLFRANLKEAMAEAGLSQSALARRVGVDRSTLSQLLSAESDRLPRADTVAAMAAALQVSLDWLLGLRQEKDPGADILDQGVEIAADAPEAAEERLRQWHEAAAGYKIRYVPATVPDLLKSDRVIDYEATPFEVVRPEDAQALAADQLAYSRLPETDMEVCNTVQYIAAFARGEGLWAGLTTEERTQQLERMIHLVEELYPTFRWFLFDGRQRYSAPLTIFGPRRAVIYVGQMYFVFNTTEHIRVLTRHFDDLIRSAVVQPTDVAQHLRRHLAELEREAAA
ncbi:MAG: helix-turn-helix transcriptional regulator [Alphaproteobacteria bacterium]|jgi:transcriptional regulator with XRE-family HTH domain|nr:helix-turn-helix transcriptional regulator [Alphaproteobacteria bacterium]